MSSIELADLASATIEYPAIRADRPTGALDAPVDTISSATTMPAGSTTTTARRGISDTDRVLASPRGASSHSSTYAPESRRVAGIAIGSIVGVWRPLLGGLLGGWNHDPSRAAARHVERSPGAPCVRGAHSAP